MSESSDRSSGNRIVRTVCKVYNVIYVSNMKGYGSLERDTRGASKNLSLIYQHCKLARDFLLRRYQLRKMRSRTNSLDVKGDSRFHFNAAIADIARTKFNLFSKSLLQNISCFCSRSGKGVSRLQ